MKLTITAKAAASVPLRLLLELFIQYGCRGKATPDGGFVICTEEESARD